MHIMLASSITRKHHCLAVLRRPFSGAAAAAASSVASPLTVAEAEERIRLDDANRNDDATEKALHFSLSGTGPAMFAWMVGWCHGLQRSGVLSANDGSNKFLGISGGSVCGAFLAAGIDLSPTSDVMAVGQEQSDRCRDGKQRLGDLVSNMMEDLFPEDVAARIVGDGGNDKRNNLYVAMVRAPGGGIAGLSRAMRNEIILHHQFTDRRDLIGAMKATTHLPFISDGNAAATYRGESVVDAGITGQMFVPTSATSNVVHVNIFPPLDCVPVRENVAGRCALRTYAKWCNRARAPVHAHPYDAKGFHLGVFGRDDLVMRPIEKEEALARHRLGQEAFASWWDANKGKHGKVHEGSAKSS